VAPRAIVLMVDTDVLIWYLRGHPEAKVAVESVIPFSVSVVTFMELVQGMKDKTELRRFQKAFRAWNVEVIHIDREISSRASFYVQEYALSHSMMIADALIAATAVQIGETLLTANDKHYRFVPGLEIKKFLVG
jgi:predicted nucleic acid-binding protein